MTKGMSDWGEGGGQDHWTSTEIRDQSIRKLIYMDIEIIKIYDRSGIGMV